MPEGPSIVILREAAAQFRGRTVRGVEGDSRLDLGRMQGQRIESLRSWGKHFLIEFTGFSMRVHLLMFGTYCINERKDRPARLSLQFDRGSELNFYTCSLQYVEGPLDEAYDWSGDVMSDAWDSAAARRKLKARPDMLVCDALLDQTIFSGVGNIIKNDALYRIGVDPRSFDFLDWKRESVLKQHWQVHTKTRCPHCGGPVVKKYLGKTNRRSFFCPRLQVLYE
jgi:endonuclease-8